MAIEQWTSRFFSVPHLLRHGASVYNGHLWGPVTLTPFAERLAVDLSQPVLSRLGFEHPTTEKHWGCYWGYWGDTEKYWAYCSATEGHWSCYLGYWGDAERQWDFFWGNTDDSRNYWGCYSEYLQGEMRWYKETRRVIFYNFTKWKKKPRFYIFYIKIVTVILFYTIWIQSFR